MRHYLLITLLGLPLAAAATEYLDELDGNVVQIEGVTAEEIAKRGRRCIAQIIRNEEVQISDSSSSPGLFGFGLPPSQGNVRGVTGGSVIVDADVEAGLITANSRIDYTSLLIGYNVKSTVTLMTKDGRFKIKHTNIERAQKSTGTMANDGYSKIVKKWGTGWEAAQNALADTTRRLNDCIADVGKKEDW